MKNSIKRVVSIIMIMVTLIPTAAFANSTKTLNLDRVKVEPDGREIEYYQDYMDKIFWDLPRIIRTKTGSTVRYDVNQISNAGEAWSDHAIIDTGAYLEVDNVVREGEQSEFRVLYTKSPAKVTFSTTQHFRLKKIIEFERYEVVNGNIMYNTGLDSRTNKVYSKETLFSVDGKYEQIEFNEPGLYMVTLEATLGRGVTTYIYVAKEGEDLTYTAPKQQNAIPTTAKVKVNGKDYNAPAYNINGENYLRIRDIAYMVNWTGKQFNVAYSDFMNKNGHIAIMTADYNSAYEAVGGEMKALETGNKIAKPTAQTMALNSSQINPIAYSIDGSNFVKLRDIANIIDFGLVWNEATATVEVDTNVGYTKQ